MKSVPLILAATLLATGCSSHLVSIRPAELPKMNGHFYFQRNHTNYFSEIKFRDLRGRIKKVGRPRNEKQGQMEAQVVLNNGGRFDFSHPVESRFADGVLTVEGGNREPMRFAEADIKHVEIHFSPPEERTLWGRSKYGDKIVVYRVTTDPPGGKVFRYKWGDPFATLEQGTLYYFHHKRSRNFYVPVTIEKSGYKTVDTRLLFEKAYPTEKEARANPYTFRFRLEPL